MNEKFDVVALGELLIDFTQNGVSGQGNPLHAGRTEVKDLTARCVRGNHSA